jgi:phosphopantothenoylcysteine synthetase/decarboxylase
MKMILGILTGMSAYKVVSDTLKTVVQLNKASKFVKNVVYPIGIACIAGTVGDAVAKHTNDEIKEAKQIISETKKIVTSFNGPQKEETERVNVFEKAEEGDDNGGSENA